MSFQKEEEKEEEEEGEEKEKEEMGRSNTKEQGQVHSIRCVLARTASNFGQKRHFCRISTPV